MTQHKPAQAKGKTMKARITFPLLPAALLVTPLALAGALDAASAQSVTSPARSIAIAIGRGELITLPGRMSDVFVANNDIADVQVKATNQLYVFGKAGGETTVYASNGKGDVIWSANVRVGTNIDSVDQMLHLAMPDAKISTATMNSTVLLTGTVGAPEDAAEAERLVKAFVGDKTQVISRLKLATPLQVNLQVRIAEVSRSLVKSLTSNITSIDGTGGFKFGIGQGSAASTFHPGAPLGVGSSVSYYGVDPSTGQVALLPGTTVNPASTGTTLAAAGKLFGLGMLAKLDAAETVGLATTLAQPNLTTMSGETADFLAGGEFPIPMSQGLGTTSVEYKRYGVSLSYTPTVLSNGRISMRVRPEVSELSSQGAVQISGFTIPGLTVRRTETTVELGSGQSFMIAGLMNSNSQNNIQKLPGAGDIPILGSLFRSTGFKRGETELVIVVTPYLVNPVDANQIKLPTDGFQAANDLQRILGNMESDSVSGKQGMHPTEKPSTVQSGSQVGALDKPSGPAAAADKAAPEPRNARRSGKSAEAPAPGFSIN
ncbi:type II and III secretion system protein family protein [Novosphingobium sp. EMRT-2]|uniref:type II and III secretion system protein family protein n=1 Tax=Novosphingobium sp. EMRT-2 TaxID=2571749 RepID=UPI00210555B8|nr:type II and III secretion system protein family protein [Novosphingobium sp. EMRT-2]